MRIIKPYAIKQKPIMERLNSPFVFLAVFIPFIALCVHAYTNKPQTLGELVHQEVKNYDSNKTKPYKPRPNVLNKAQEKLTTGISAYVSLYTDEGEVK